MGMSQQDIIDLANFLSVLSVDRVVKPPGQAGNLWDVVPNGR
jgi:hypothetical protein